MSPRLFHYTVGVHLADIRQDRVICPATAHVPEGEKPVVWLTYGDQWERTCNKAVMEGGRRRAMTMEETHEHGGGLWRIEVDPELEVYDMQDFRRLSGINRRMWKALVALAKRDGSDVSLWRVSFQPVTIDRWRALECWNSAADEWAPPVPDADGVIRIR